MVQNACDQLWIRTLRYHCGCHFANKPRDEAIRLRLRGLKRLDTLAYALLNRAVAVADDRRERCSSAPRRPVTQDAGRLAESRCHCLQRGRGVIVTIVAIPGAHGRPSPEHCG